MKILRLRTHYGIATLKGENTWTAGDAGTELRMVPGGHFVVSKYGKHVLLPSTAVSFGEVEPEKASEIIAEEKRGPGRPKKEQGPE